MRFDAYCATIPEATMRDVAVTLADSMDGIVNNGSRMKRFGQVLSIDVGNRMAAWVGQEEYSGHVYVEAKGETTPALASVIREQYEYHKVPRADVCEDYDEPGAFERIQAIIRAHKGPRVKGGYVALPDDLEDGRTWAAGVRGGVVYIRDYEAGKHPDRVHLNRPNWARFEGEFRPHYARDKLAASTMSPVEFFGLSSWSHKVGQAITGTDINRFVPEIRKYSHDKTTWYVAKTFRRHLEEMIENGEDITRTFQDVWQELDRQQRRRLA